MKRKCAYCNSSDKLTNEHAIPNFLYKLTEGRQVGYNLRAKKITESEHKIKDVCEKCNNGPLSKLDSYGKKLFINNNLDKHYPPNVTIKFNFDYDLLLRLLLKMSYNSSRMSGNFLDLYSDVKNYILYGSDLDKISNLRIFLEIVSYYKLKPEEKRGLEESKKNTIFANEDVGEYLFHDKFSVGRAKFLKNKEYDNVKEILSSYITVSYITINSYFFYVIHFDKDINSKEIDSILRNDIEFLICSKRLTRRNQKAKIKVSKRNTSNHPLIKNSYLKQKPSWDEYYSENIFLDDSAK